MRAPAVWQGLATNVSLLRVRRMGNRVQAAKSYAPKPPPGQLQYPGALGGTSTD